MKHTPLEKKLLEGCKFFIDCLHQGLLIRDIKNDSDPDWVIKMMDFVKKLKGVTDSIAEAEGRE